MLSNYSPLDAKSSFKLQKLVMSEGSPGPSLLFPVSITFGQFFNFHFDGVSTWAFKKELIVIRFTFGHPQEEFKEAPHVLLNIIKNMLCASELFNY